jgi:hypothetical protein
MSQTVNHAVQVVPMCFLLSGTATAKPSPASYNNPKVEKRAADVFRRTANSGALCETNAKQCVLLQPPPAYWMARIWRRAIKGQIQQWWL